MSHPLSWIDRLRIERVVWMLDQRLYDLPRQSRIAKRREVRENLLVAAHDVGARQALRQLGDNRELAREYLAAELGTGPRHSWVAAMVFAGTVPFLVNWVLGEAVSAYGDGVLAGDPRATGTFTWSGIAYLQDTVTYTFTNGTGSSVGGAWTPLTYLLWVVGTVLVSRAWRALPVFSRREG